MMEVMQMQVKMKAYSYFMLIFLSSNLGSTIQNNLNNTVGSISSAVPILL